jgi:hypothetical protein
MFLALGTLMLTFATGNPAYAKMAPSWVWPTYQTTKPVDKVRTVVRYYDYQERQFSPPIIVKKVPLDKLAFDQVEHAFISRISVMMEGDFDRWLGTWDPRSRSRFLAREKSLGRTSDYWPNWWKDVFTHAHYLLTRRIDAGPYVILTYRMVDANGNDVGQGLEIPAIFKEENGLWFATADLSSDVFAPASPWVSGEMSHEQEVR